MGMGRMLCGRPHDFIFWDPIATVGLWVSESHRESGISNHDPWPAPYEMC